MGVRDWGLEIEFLEFVGFVEFTEFMTRCIDEEWSRD